MCLFVCIYGCDGCVCLFVQMVVMDVYNCRFHRMYNDKDSLNLILDRDDIFVYELPPDQNDFISVCVYFREVT